MAYGKIEETFWDDPVLRGLSQDARFFMLYLLTTRHRTRLGLYVLPPAYAAEDLQWTVDRVEAARKELEKTGRIHYDKDNRCVFIKRFLKHNTLENRRVIVGALAEVRGIPDTYLFRELLKAAEHYKRAHYTELLDALRNRIAYRIDRVKQTELDVIGKEPNERPKGFSGEENSHSPNLSKRNNLDTVCHTVPDTIPASRAFLPSLNLSHLYKTPIPLDGPGSFEEFWKLYPKREGGNPKAAAERKWKARIKAGTLPAEMIAGAQRYAAYIKTPATEARFVKQAQTFLGPDEWWKESWHATESKRTKERTAEEIDLKGFQQRFEGKVPDIKPRSIKPRDGEEGTGPTKVGALLPKIPPPPMKGG